MIGAKYPNPNLPWPLPRPHVGDLATDEGCRLVSYRNFPNEPWTNGWGETDGVGPGMVWTQEYADQRFCDSMTERVNAVLEACTRKPTPNQLCAMVRLVYNIGMGWEGKVKPLGAKNGFRQSTVLRQHNAGNFAAAAEAFALWDKISDGKGGLMRNDALHARRFTIAVETNGTVAAPPGLDWICVSPKAGSELVLRKGHELKLVYPQPENTPEDFAGLEFERFSLQPMDGPDIAQSIQAAIAYCLAHPQWRLSVQTHKTLGIR